MRKPKKTKYGDYATWVEFEVMANYCVRVILSNDIVKSAQERIGRGPGEGADAFCYHVHDTGRSYIFLPLDAPEGTVVHECWHIVRQIMAYCHVQELDDEVIAYHLDHIVEKVYDFKRAIQSSIKEEENNDNGKCINTDTRAITEG